MSDSGILPEGVLPAVSLAPGPDNHPTELQTRKVDEILSAAERRLVAKAKERHKRTRFARNMTVRFTI